MNGSYNERLEVLTLVDGDRAEDPLRPLEGGASAELDAHAGRWVRRHMAGGVSVITTSHGERFRGATVSACVTTSIVPFQLLVSIEQDSQMADWLDTSGAFVANILPWEEQFLADRFAGFAPLASGTFHGIPHTVGVSGAPILENCLAWIDCRIVASFPTGDHICYVGEAVALGSGKGRADNPLIYFFNRYHQLD